VQAEALKFLIHLVGYIHQPMHAVDNDDSAATPFASIGGMRTNIHYVWNVEMVEALVARDQLAMAGLRLARLLNGIFR